MSYKDKLDSSKLPKHIAVIMDGNGRWAKQKGQERVFGHQNGVKSVREVVEAAAELKIEFLTLYAFSTENWNRPESEVGALMALLVNTIHRETKTLNENNVRLQAIGDLTSLPEACYRELQDAIALTSTNTGLTLVLALSYSSRWEMVRAVQNIALQVKAGTLAPEAINEALITKHLCTEAFPEPELMIRTSGEHRISNFLLWQMAYTELYFTDTLWPDFRRENLYQAIYDYQNRERRFGKTSEQLTSDSH